jgi:hypothetical protein
LRTGNFESLIIVKSLHKPGKSTVLRDSKFPIRNSKFDLAHTQPLPYLCTWQQ